MNTEVVYQYRTLTGETKQQSAVVEGELPDDGLTRIFRSLHREAYFIPAAVGLPERRIKAWAAGVDVPWFELQSCDITSRAPTVSMTASELVAGFERKKDHWTEFGPMSILQHTLSDLLKENEEDMESLDDRYFQGYHDAILDVMLRMGVCIGAEQAEGTGCGKTRSASEGSGPR